MKDTDMKWELERIDWHSNGLCWSWLEIRKRVYYSGNQVQWVWGRIAFVFERRNWIHSLDARVEQVGQHPLVLRLNARAEKERRRADRYGDTDSGNRPTC